MSGAIYCSERDVKKFRELLEKRDEQIKRIYEDKEHGALPEIYRIFKDNLTELERQADDSCYYIGLDIVDAQDGIAKNEAAIKKLEERIRGYEKDIEGYRADISKLNSAISALSNSLSRAPSGSEYEEYRSSLRSAISERESERSDLYDSIDAVKRQIEECRAAIKRIEDMIYELNRLIEAAEKTRLSIKETVQKRQTLLSDIGSMLEDVGSAYSSYLKTFATANFSAERAATIISGLYDTFFRLSGSFPDHDEPIAVKSSDVFRGASRSLDGAAEGLSESADGIAHTTRTLGAAMQDEVTRDAAESIAPMHKGIEYAAGELREYSTLTRKCAELVSAYEDLA